MIQRLPELKRIRLGDEKFKNGRVVETTKGKKETIDHIPTSKR